MDPDLESVSIHESGHALILLGLGMSLKSVSVVADEESLGRVSVLASSRTAEVDPAGEYGDRFEVLDALGDQMEVLFLSAGVVAQEIGGFDTTGGGSDERAAAEAEDRVFRLLGPYTPMWLARVRRDLERYLRAHWPAVERIAKALVAEGELDGERVRELAGPLPLPHMGALRVPLYFAKKRRPAGRGKEPVVQKFLVVSGFKLNESLGDVYEGQVVEVSEKDAAYAISLGRLRPISSQEAAELSSKPA